MPGGRPRKYNDEERKEYLKTKNSRYYQANKAKWDEYNANHTETYFASQIRNLAKHLDSETQFKVIEAIQNVPARKT